MLTMRRSAGASVETTPPTCPVLAAGGTQFRSMREEQESKEVTMCNLFISFKSLLLFIYGLIDLLIGKISGNGNGLKGPALLKSQPLSKTVMDFPGNNNEEESKVVKGIHDIPGPRSLPFFGTLLTSSTLTSSDLRKANEERERLYGPIMKEEHFWNFPLIMIMDAEMIKQIIKDNPTTRPPMEILCLYRQLRPDRYSTVGIVNAQSDAWKHLSHGFGSTTKNMGFVRSLLPVFDEIAGDFVSLIGKSPSTTTNLPRMVNLLTTECSFYLVYGQRIGLLGEKREGSEKWSLFSDCHESYWSAFHRSMYGFPFWKYFPTKAWRDFSQAEDKLMTMVNQLIDELEATGKQGGLLKEMLDKDSGLSRGDLSVVLQEFTLGATNPIQQTTLICLYYISKNEHIYNRVMEEVRAQLPNKDSPVDEEVLNNIPYLKACVMEVFRFSPVTPNLARILDKETNMGGYRLPQHSVVILQSWHACLQERNFYRAKEFLPERWLLEDGHPPYQPHNRQIMLNFGLGARACPGRKLGRDILHTLLCKVFRNYRAHFPQGMNIVYEWILTVKDPLSVEFIEIEE